MRKVVVASAVTMGICFIGTACVGPSQRAAGPAPTNALTAPSPSFGTPVSTAVRVPAVPVTVSGSGDEVKTVNLEPGGYTVKYTDTSGFLIVVPVKRDGSTGTSIVNAFSKSGVTTYASTGPVTLQVKNGGDWSLQFDPLS